MSRGSVIVQGVVAGIGVFIVDVWPVLAIWWAGTSGTVGDLSDVQFLGIGIAYGVAVGAAAGCTMTRWLPRAAVSPDLGRLDPWGAYALGVGVYTLALTAVPAIIYGLLLTDENRSLRERMWLIELLWIGGHLLATLISYLSARAVLGRGLVDLDDPGSTEVSAADT